MSLINQMLKDLDARGQGGGGGNAGHVQVRAVSDDPVSKRNIAIGGAGVVLLAAALAGGWFWYKGRTPAAMAPAVSKPIQVAQQAAVPQPVPDVQGSAAAKSLSYDLKMSPELTQGRPPAKAAAVKVAEKPPEIKPQATARLRAAEKMAEPASVPASVSMSAPARASGPAPGSAAGSHSALPARAAEKQREPVVVSSVPSSARGVATPPAQRNVKELSEQQRAENEYRTATTQIQQHKQGEAMRSLEQALYLDPLHSAARLTLAALLIEAKQPAAAIRRLKEGLSLEPSQAGMAKALARLQVERNETPAAIETLQRTLPYAGQDPEYLAFMAALLQRDNRHKEAIEMYLNAIRMAPQTGVWWMGLGISLQADHRNADATEAYNRAKATNTLSAELRAFVDQKLGQLRR